LAIVFDFFDAELDFLIAASVEEISKHFFCVEVWGYEIVDVTRVLIYKAISLVVERHQNDCDVRQPICSFSPSQPAG
jgi:hypothetical protein